MAFAQGVLGPIDADDLGVTLPHEHLILDMAVRHLPQPDEELIGRQPSLVDRWRLIRDPARYLVNLQGTDTDSAIFEVAQFQAAGGKTIVDLTAVGLSPHPKQLRTIAESLDVNVIAGTGYYISQSLPPWVATSSVTQLADN